MDKLSINAMYAGALAGGMEQFFKWYKKQRKKNNPSQKLLEFHSKVESKSEKQFARQYFLHHGRMMSLVCMAKAAEPTNRFTKKLIAHVPRFFAWYHGVRDARYPQRMGEWRAEFRELVEQFNASI